VVRNQFVEGTSYTFQVEVPIIIEPFITYSGSTSDPVSNVLSDLKVKITERCKPDTRFYITTIIYNIDGSVGGQGTATISKDDPIEII
jgi:hypothetical protein